MYALGRGGSRRSINIWPGFVDGLATLLLVVMFVLMVFMIAQYFLSTALTGRDQALERLNREITELAELLALERSANADLRINVAQLSSELQSSIAEREALGTQISALLDERETINRELAEASVAKDTLTAQLAALVEEREALERLLAEAEAVTARSREELEAAYTTIEADKETIEAQLAELAILKSLEEEMTEKLLGMESALVEQESAAETLQSRLAELESALADYEEAIAALRLELEILKQETGAERELASELRLQLEQSEAKADARDRRIAELEALLAQAEVERRKQEALLTALRAQMNTLEQTDQERAESLASLRSRIGEAEAEKEKQQELTREAQARVNLLNRQIAALRQQLARLAATLEAIEAANAAKDVQIADLGRRLNVALATKVQELARFRSEFFGRLRQVLGSRADIRVVGDRFVFQSELLFATGQAELGAEGRDQLSRLAGALKEIAAEIPPDIDWILRVDGHTDKRPIYTVAFKSNWELSTARALSVVNFLIEQGIPPDRLAATGFGEHHPLDAGENEEAFRRNRRIELKFTQK